MRKLREFYRLNKDLFAEDGHYLLLVKAPVEDWKSFEDRLRERLKKILTESAPRSLDQSGSQ